MNDSPRPTLRERLHARWRKSIFNPYHLDGKLLRKGIAELGGELHGRMLDVGCGERQYAALFPNIDRYIGIEHLAATTNVCGRLATSVAHVVGLIDAFAEGERIPFHDEVFDSCIATEVLEHVPEPAPVVREMHRVLKPNGRLLVTVPFVGELHQTPYDFRRYTIFGIRRILEDNGFEVERILARGNFPATTGRVLAHALYRLGAKEIKGDGAVRMHRWAIPLVLPLCALAQLVFGFLSRFSRDETLCLGYVVLARRR